ncbi:DUF6233 domain-containing protein [Streptomyces sp. NBC_01589]|uniref:DUF6233 domain-containing protein n=1 Tax=Streptomyces sp. NBC_01589 TaxID=2975886 RepID=UPI003864186B
METGTSEPPDQGGTDDQTRRGGHCRSSLVGAAPSIVGSTHPMGDHDARVALTDPNIEPCAFCRPDSEPGVLHQHRLGILLGKHVTTRAAMAIRRRVRRPDLQDRALAFSPPRSG